MTDNFFDFTGGTAGQWNIVKMNTLTGETLPLVSHLTITQQPTPIQQGRWTLTGLTSNIRYAERHEKEALQAIQPDLGRPAATNAALIPIRKSDAWWALAQDERRQLFEAKSHHTQTGLRYLPAIARKLYHCRDIGGPFDFLTWFEYAPAHADLFDELLYALRRTEEWTYVDREIDIRLFKA